MNTVTQPDSTQLGTGLPLRIGIVLGDVGKLNVAVLKYLVVHLNTLQHAFEFEFLSPPPNNPMIRLLNRECVVSRQTCRSMAPAFHQQMLTHIAASQNSYRLVDQTSSEDFVIIAMNRFDDNYSSMREGRVQVMALGYWDRHMAPPSIYEFVITLLLRQAVGFAAPSFSKSIHFGTKGCLFDFTSGLYDARYKSLQGYVCRTCRERLQSDGFAGSTGELTSVLAMKWLGRLDDPLCPAGIAAKLGYNLFLTKGITPTFWEAIRTQLRDEGTKEVVKIVGTIILAGILLWLGLEKSN